MLMLGWSVTTGVTSSSQLSSEALSSLFPSVYTPKEGSPSKRREGKLCQHTSGCSKYRQGRSNLCIGHGGGRKCQSMAEGVPCPRSAQGGTPFCLRHNGGRRCRTLQCPKAARGSTGYCAACGGGYRCRYPGCDKLAQRPSEFCCRHGQALEVSRMKPSYSSSLRPECSRFTR